MYCVGGYLKNLCHFEMGGGGVWQMLTSSGGGGGRSMLTVADRGRGGGKICQNLADVICERSLIKQSAFFNPLPSVITAKTPLIGTI